jgi:hypothetical protein
MRLKAARELLQTEESYVQKLKVLVEVRALSSFIVPAAYPLVRAPSRLLL